MKHTTEKATQIIRFNSKKWVIALFTIISLIFISCATAPKTVPDDASVEELILFGQNNLDISNYKAAEFYYQTVLNRYGTDLSIAVGAEFEIAHIRIKQKKWADAKERLERILGYYDSEAAENLPSHYKVLAEIDYQKIP